MNSKSENEVDLVEMNSRLDGGKLLKKIHAGPFHIVRYSSSFQATLHPSKDSLWLCSHHRFRNQDLRKVMPLNKCPMHGQETGANNEVSAECINSYLFTNDFDFHFKPLTKRSQFFNEKKLGFSPE